MPIFSYYLFNLVRFGGGVGEFAHREDGLTISHGLRQGEVVGSEMK